jgi:putative membrane protein
MSDDPSQDPSQDPSRGGTPPRRGSTSDYLANERTFLAWTRTSLGIIGLGFVMAKFSVWLRQFLGAVAPERVATTRGGASLPAGLILIGFGALLAVLAYRRHESVCRAIEEGRNVPTTSLLRMMVAVVVLVSVTMIVYLILTSASIWKLS